MIYQRKGIHWNTKNHKLPGVSDAFSASVAAFFIKSQKNATTLADLDFSQIFADFLDTQPQKSAKNREIVKIRERSRIFYEITEKCDYARGFWFFADFLRIFSMPSPENLQKIAKSSRSASVAAFFMKSQKQNTWFFKCFKSRKMHYATIFNQFS